MTKRYHTPRVAKTPKSQFDPFRVAAIVGLIVITGLMIRDASQKIQNTDTQVTTNKDSKTSSSSTLSSKNTAKSVTPSFETVTPSGSDSAPKSWVRASPESSAPAYAYTDTLSNATIVVTQQKLPKDFVENLDERIIELAKSYGASQKLPATTGTTYMSNSENGDQYIIGAKYDLLILIRSSKRLPADTWTGYLSSLK